MHSLDRLSLGYLRRQPLFASGWGALEGLEPVAQRLSVPHPAPPTRVTFRARSRWRGLDIEDGTALSPSEVVPPALKTMHVRRVLARGERRFRVIVPPSWGDAGYGLRAFFVGPLAAAGLELWLPEGAYFGARAAPLDTVEQFSRMGLTHVDETRSLLQASRDEGVPVAMLGYSMAGQLGSMAVQALPHDIPVIAMAAPDSAAAVFIEGPLSKQVRWEALGADGRARLSAALSRFSVLAQPPPTSTRRAVSLNRLDGIVAPESTERIASHWGVEPMRFHTGHVGAYLAARRAAHRLVLETLGLRPR